MLSTYLWLEKISHPQFLSHTLHTSFYAFECFTLKSICQKYCLFSSVFNFRINKQIIFLFTYTCCYDSYHNAIKSTFSLRLFFFSLRLFFFFLASVFFPPRLVYLPLLPASAPPHVSAPSLFFFFPVSFSPCSI